MSGVKSPGMASIGMVSDLIASVLWPEKAPRETASVSETQANDLSNSSSENKIAETPRKVGAGMSALLANALWLEKKMQENTSMHTTPSNAFPDSEVTSDSNR